MIEDSNDVKRFEELMANKIERLTELETEIEEQILHYRNRNHMQIMFDPDKRVVWAEDMKSEVVWSVNLGDSTS